MGFALAEACAERGAKVYLISGPVELSITHKNITRIDVESAEEMYQQANKHFVSADISILAAAVADFTPSNKATSKLKKKEDSFSLELKQTKDIATELGKNKKASQILVGFALETNDEESNALEKLKKKNFDFIVLNSLNDKNAGFGHDTNKISIYSKNGSKTSYPLKSKMLVANDIIDTIEQLHTT